MMVASYGGHVYVRNVAIICLLGSISTTSGSTDVCLANQTLCNPPYGECTSNSEKGEYLCTCKTQCNREGRNCRHPIHLPCSEGGCGAHGKCIEVTPPEDCDKYTKCECDNGFHGQYCEEDWRACYDCAPDNEKCFSFPCSRNGECVNITGGFKCSCENGGGTFCELTAPSDTWGWSGVALVIFSIVAASVLLERIWSCIRKKIIKMQGREGFSRVYQDDEDDDVVNPGQIQRSEQGVYGEIEIERIGEEREDADPFGQN
eukprot:CAMPEP_0184481470 /NCGR_PEP_ID=MMETSP0113_2-20130426/3014_1 /TAXON_ID=91329 /ORGANISM="Norrisiella sphaerica, Strain BC52" /LENGTH=259 /DNA_ID=CAMNT_0026860611 /DNA_START=86 /DNA_END=865 /DNA_ORIENTATION=+